MNRAEEDYIKAIFQLKENNPSKCYVSNTQIAKYFNHTLQSVNEMVKKLVKQNLLTYQPYKGSKLTDKGSQLAERMIRIHRIWETFLVEKLGYGWEEVHQEAELLEHITSQKLENRLYDFLGNPMKCPHGNVIISKTAPEHTNESVKLIDANKGSSYQIQNVVDKEDVLLAMNRSNLNLGDIIYLEAYDTINENVIVTKDNERIYIGFKVSNFIYVAINK